MALQTVIVTVSNIGINAGPFTITDEVLGVVATNVTSSQLIAGYTITGDNTSTYVLVTSEPPCNTELYIYYVTPTPTANRPPQMAIFRSILALTTRFMLARLALCLTLLVVAAQLGP